MQNSLLVGTRLILPLHLFPKVTKLVGGQPSQTSHAPDHMLYGKYLPPWDWEYPVQ